MCVRERVGFWLKKGRKTTDRERCEGFSVGVHVCTEQILKLRIRNKTELKMQTRILNLNM